MDFIYDSASSKASNKDAVHGLNNTTTDEAWPNKKKPNDLNQNAQWLSDADEILSDINHNHINKDQLKASQLLPSMGIAMTLLKRARRIISNAEKRIKEQDKRIATLEALSNTDELTCISNRRGFMHELIVTNHKVVY
jgi:hypothetical protein